MQYLATEGGHRPTRALSWLAAVDTRVTALHGLPNMVPAQHATFVWTTKAKEEGLGADLFAEAITLCVYVNSRGCGCT